MAMFRIDTEGRWTTVHPAGEIDVAVAGEFGAAIAEALSQDRSGHLATDFSEVTVLDSSGLGVIAVTLRQVRDRGGHLVLVRRLTERVRLVLEITEIDKIVDVRDRLAAGDEFTVEWTLEHPDLSAAG
jgi:anti-anti-sigma factor